MVDDTPPLAPQPLPPRNRASTANPELDARIEALIRAAGGFPNDDLIRELIATSIKIGRDGAAVADLKLFNRTLKELRHAARVLAPFAGRRKVAVFGSARLLPQEPAAIAAERFGRRMSELGFMTITGGGDGIMGAAQRGAGREMSFGLNIRLPFEQRPNETIDGDEKLVNFNYFFTRKLNFLKETHAVALFPGGFGTMDEGFEVITLMQTGKARIMPLVLVDEPGGTFWSSWIRFVKEHLLQRKLVSAEDFAFIKWTDDIEVATQEIAGFYRVFHSYRWAGDRMVIRIAKRLTAEALASLNRSFSAILRDGRIDQTAALPEEADETELAALPRLVLTPIRREFGTFRNMIDAINASVVECPQTGSPRAPSNVEEPLSGGV